MKKKLFCLFTIIACFILSGCTTALNKTKTIKADNIKITVLGSEEVTINNGDFALDNGDYVKVKMTIENIGDTAYGWTISNFKLGDETPSLNAVAESDVLSDSIAPGESATGYIYFDKTDADILEYTSDLYADGNSTAVEKVEFKIK